MQLVARMVRHQPKWEEKNPTMLLITDRAVCELEQMVASAAAQTGRSDARPCVRIIVGGPDNGGHGQMECKITIAQEGRGDQIEDAGGIEVLVDPLTSLRLQHISLILDFLKVGREGRFVLTINEG
jgi:Fe-S cluster assembly iron-binding protein IscA